MHTFIIVLDYEVTDIVSYLCSFFLFIYLKDTMARRPADPEEELRWMSQEVRGYVEAVLNSLAANVPKVSLWCWI